MKVLLLETLGDLLMRDFGQPFAEFDRVFVRAHDKKGVSSQQSESSIPPGS